VPDPYATIADATLPGLTFMPGSGRSLTQPDAHTWAIRLDFMPDDIQGTVLAILSQI